MSDAIRQKHAFAMGQTTPGYGTYSGHMSGGSSMKGHQKSNGGIGKASHGHSMGVGGVGMGGVVGTTPTSGKQDTAGSSGQSKNQFGGGMPSGNGSSLRRW